MTQSKNPPSAAIDLDHYKLRIKSSSNADIYECGYLTNVDATPDLVIAPLTTTIVHNSTSFTQEQTKYYVQVNTTTEIENGYFKITF